MLILLALIAVDIIHSISTQSIHLLKKKKKASLTRTSFPLTGESFFPEKKPFHGLSLAGSLRQDREDLKSGGLQDIPSMKQEDRDFPQI